MARGSTPALIIVAVLAAGAAASVTDVLGYVNPFAEDTKRLYDGVAGATEAEVSALLEAHGAAGAYREFHCAEPVTSYYASCESPLHLAASSGNLGAVRALLAAGAPQSSAARTPNLRPDFDARARDGFALCALRGVLDESTRLVRTSATSTSM